MTAPERSLSTADRALLRSIRAWGGVDFERSASRFSASWRERLLPSWPEMAREKPDAAWASLRSDHDTSARPDPARVHPSWFVRALKSESPAVRLSVVGNLSGPLRETLRRDLKIDSADLETDRAPDPEALAWALSLWAERLVGDVPDRDEDHPVIVAMTRLVDRDLARLIKVCGLVKHAFAIEGSGPAVADEATARFTPMDRVRLGFFRRQIGQADPRLVPLARIDLERIDGDRRRAHARVGLATFGRLLARVEPHRARWALQHIPYPIARLMKAGPALPMPVRAIEHWESWVLEAAWVRLFSEGRLAGGRVPGFEAEQGASI